ncbi:MAG: N-6 DNA methylase, partial [Clostridiales bacterium]|nr:N-6 DNA methylase [Clostridiales bacterium]
MNGYLGILGENSGIVISRGEPAALPLSNRPLPETLTLNWTAVHRRVAELVNDGRFSAVEALQDPAALAEYQKIKAENPGSVVFFQVGENIEFLQEDAEITAKLLELPLTTRNAGLPEPISVLSISVEALSDAVSKVYDAGYSLAIAELTDGENSAHKVTKVQHNEGTEQTEEQSRLYSVSDEYTRLKAENGEAIVMWQVGVFFEFYGEDAVKAADLLGLTLIERQTGEAGVVPMCGVPANRLSDYIHELNEAGHTVVVAENLENGNIETTVYAASTTAEPDLASQETSGQTDKTADAVEPSEPQIESGAADVQNIGPPKSPPPVFFVDWEKAQRDFDLSLYQNRDIIGYDVKGVEQRLGRSGRLTYVTSTGAFWGSNEVPGNIYEQIESYKNGEVTEDQVRDNYIAVLEAHKAAVEAWQRQNTETAQSMEPPTAEPIPGDVPAALEQATAEPLMVIDNISRQNYNLFALAFPEIVNGIYRSMTFENPENKHILSVSHAATNAGNIHFEISYYTPGGDKVFAPTITFEANFENRMLKPVQYANTLTDVDIGILSLPSPDDAERLEALSADIYKLIADIKKQGFTLKNTDVFYGNDGQPLPAAPKPGLISFLKERADHEAAEHFNVQRNMFGSAESVDDLTQQSIEMFDADALASDRNRQFIRDRNLPAANVPSADRRNFRITDDHLGEGGAKMKYGFNVAAIRTLQAIEAENRLATPEEQETLSRYVGWGGIQQAFDKDAAGWSKEYAELKSLLTPEEYDSARASTLNAHYTSPTVIKAMYETLERMGVNGGNILEPSLGVGNFFGLLPDSMRSAKLYGVEIDSITGRLAKQLYQQADIKVMGFEKTETPDAFFDAAVGNVPFGAYKISDKKYDKHNFYVHNYFFAKTLDQVRPGGIIAFVTTKGMMDRANPEVRKYIAQRAELLGAVRLPNNAFLKTAGTEVTSDIVFLQKRDRQIDIMPDWVHMGQTEDGLPVNSYFADNPHIILGRMTNDQGTRMYGGANETACEPIPGADLAEQLKEALSHIEGQITEAELEDIEGIQDNSIPADPSVRNFSYTIVDKTVYFRENSRMYPVEMPSATLERVKGMVELRDVTRLLIDLQLDDYPEHTIKKKQAELSKLYDNFTRKFGLVNDTANAKAFQADSSYYLLCSLEILDENGSLERKSDMFTKRTIRQNQAVTSVDTSSEALAVSIGEKARVDIDYMAALTGFTPEKIMADLEGVIFCDIGNPNRKLPDFNPETMKVYEKFPLITADEYLSGNVREKLARARAFQEAAGDIFHGINVAVSVKALEQAQPKELEAGEIAVRLGSTWVNKSYYQE